VKDRAIVVALVCAVLLAAPCRAGSQVSIRLVEASNDGSGSPSGLNDVAGTLRDSLGFNRCSLIASAVIVLPVTRQTRQLGEYQVLCVGPQRSLSIEVSRGGKRLLKTNVSLQDGKPLLLGGFPSPIGKQVLVFLAR